MQCQEGLCSIELVGQSFSQSYGHKYIRSDVVTVQLKSRKNALTHPDTDSSFCLIRPDTDSPFCLIRPDTNSPFCLIRPDTDSPFCLICPDTDSRF